MEAFHIMLLAFCTMVASYGFIYTIVPVELTIIFIVDYSVD